MKRLFLSVIVNFTFMYILCMLSTLNFVFIYVFFFLFYSVVKLIQSLLWFLLVICY